MPLNGFGFGELLLISMLVLIVFGPKRLPEITRTIGKGIREFKKGMNEIQRELETADRETRWKSPPAPPARTEAGKTPSAEESSERADPSNSAAEATPVEDTHQPPPTSRDAADPADEFIDPWATDSSRPTFNRTREPALEPPTGEPAVDVADSIPDASTPEDATAPEDTVDDTSEEDF